MKTTLLVATVSIASIAAALLLGCASALQPEVASVGSHEVKAVPPGRIGAPFVQAGTLFSVRLDEPLDTFYSAPGTPFTATVVNPLFSTEGKLLVPYGAKVHGTIASVGTYDLPKLRVDLHSIETVAGPAPFEAAVRDAQHYLWAGPDPIELETSTPPSAQFGNRDLRLPQPSSAYTNLYGFNTSQPREVRVPRGALVELSLLTPLVEPSNSSRDSHE